MLVSQPKDCSQASAIRPAKISDQLIRGGIIDLRRDAIHAGLPAEGFPQGRREKFMFFEGEESCETSRVEVIKGRPQLGQIPQRQLPSVPQIRSGLERPIISRVIKFRQFRCVLRVALSSEIASRCIIAVRKRKASVIAAVDGDLPDATQACRQPIPERAFLREQAHFNARAMRNAACSRKSRSSSVNASSFSLSTSIRPTAFPDSVTTGTTISEFVLPKVGK